MNRTNKPESQSSLGNLVQAALEGDAREGITNLLREIASLTKSFGCVLWRATQDAEPPEVGSITMLAGWFDADNSFFGINRIPFKNTLTGKAAVEGWALDNDLTGHKNPYCTIPFFVRHGVNKAVACRFKFLSGRLGVLMTYRQSGSADFERDFDITLLKEISKVLPFLYNGARQKASYSLLKEVGQILRDARGTSASKSSRRKIFKKLVAALGKTFHSVETSLFLEDDHERGLFKCASTSKGPHSKAVWQNTYKATLDGGFSALCLYSKDKVRVHDVQDSRVELESYRKKYPSFRGHVRTGLSDIVNQHLGNPEPPPPHSSMIAPLLADGELLGFLRCWVAKSGPSYFSSDDVDLLQLVADFVSQTIAAWKQQQQAVERRKKDHRAFTALVKSRKNGQSDIFGAALGVIVEVMPEAAFNTIRLRRADSDQFYFHSALVSPDYAAGKEGLSESLKLPTQLSGSSLASKVVQTKKLGLFRGVQLTNADVATEAGEMIIAPILVGDQVEGVLDLRTKRKDRFSPQAEAVAESISTLLGLQMARERAEIDRLEAEKQKLEVRSRADRDLADSERAMRDAFEDVSHQIKSPLGEAARRVEHASSKFRQGAVAQELDSISTLLRRAELTAKLIGLFANLAKGKELAITGTPHTQVDLVRMVGQICENQRPRISPRRNIRIELDAESFYRHAPSDLSADSELLLQALNNLVDNAVKYSYPNTVIRVFGAALKRGGFIIVVTNKGIPIKPEEVHQVRVRNWRGDMAKASAGEGNGLGLWIVDHIMKAHRGDLQVLPTRAIDGITEVRLAFPFAT